MTDRVAIRRLPPGVLGLDQILGGGLPEFSFNLIAGTPGAGKTTLAQQIMFALSGPDRSALYFTVVGEPLCSANIHRGRQRTSASLKRMRARAPLPAMALLFSRTNDLHGSPSPAICCS
jgi:predicted ATP-dependent serine protease